MFSVVGASSCDDSSLGLGAFGRASGLGSLRGHSDLSSFGEAFAVELEVSETVSDEVGAELLRPSASTGALALPSSFALTVEEEGAGDKGGVDHSGAFVVLSSVSSWPHCIEGNVTTTGT